MAGEKDVNAAKNLPPDKPTQETDKGLKVGVPTREAVLAALRRVARIPPEQPKT
jgi:hypothetical protein